jgi:hypothetical protein
MTALRRGPLFPTCIRRLRAKKPWSYFFLDDFFADFFAPVLAAAFMW